MPFQNWQKCFVAFPEGPEFFPMKPSWTEMSNLAWPRIMVGVLIRIVLSPVSTVLISVALRFIDSILNFSSVLFCGKELI